MSTTKVELRNLNEKIIFQAPDNRDLFCHRCLTITPHTLMGIGEDCNHIEPQDGLEYRCTYCDEWNSLRTIECINLKNIVENGQ